MKGFVRWVSVVAAAAALAVSCSKDKPSGSLSFDSPAVFVQAGEQVTVGFTASSNIAASSYSVTAKPAGWDEPQVNAAARTITIQVPRTFGDGVAESGTVTLSGAPSGGAIVSASVFVGKVDEIRLEGPANSFIANQANTHYTFDAMRMGDGKTTLATASVHVVWQSASGLLQYVALEDGEVSFYVGTDDNGDRKEGNALIGAYDRSGTLIWSWHVWVTDYDPNGDDGTVEYNGYTLMTRNLGALKNANTTSEEILSSYGLYYQWGRKEPFIGPSTYTAGQGASAAMYDGKGTRVMMKTVESDGQTGTMAYATQHPLTYITVEGKDADWLYPSAATVVTTRWADTKTVNDPCPAGWRVAPAAAFDGLHIVEDLNAADAANLYYDKYGWTLSDGAHSSLFIGAGYRIYLDGKISNIYDNLPVRSEAIDMQPWVGYYWTSGTKGELSSSFYFWFNKSNVPGSGVRNNAPMGRANGMQVRCVKIK